MSTNKINEPFIPKTIIEKFVHAGDYDGLTEYLAGLTEAQRLAERTGVRKLYKVMHEILLWTKPEASAWGRVTTDQQERALHIAVYVCGSPEDMVQDWFAFYHRRSALVELWKRIPRDDIQSYADLAVARHTNSFPVLHALFRARMIDHPVHDNYVLGLIALPVNLPPPRVPNPNFPLNVGRLHEIESPLFIRGLMEEDPEFAHTTLLRLFEVEGNADTSLAHFDKYGTGLNSPRNTRHELFLDLCKEGIFGRALLLDKTLGALERDWLQFRSGWFSRFHDTLAPTVEELRANRARYMGLCHSRIPTTVTLALAALLELIKHDAMPSEELLVALAPAMSSKTKAHILSALNLLDTLVKGEPSAAASAVNLAAHALIYDASDVQKQAIQRLQRWGVNDEVKDLLRQFLPMVAATHRDAVQALIADGELETSSDAAIDPQSLPESRPPLSPLDPSRHITPIVTVDELIDHLAYSLEHSTDVDGFERAVEALVRMAADVTADAKRFGPVLKRARKLNKGKPLSQELSRLLIAMLTQERLPPVDSFEKGNFSAGAFLGLRIDELIETAIRHPGLPPLAAPTHKLGYIDPAVLVARVAAEQAADVVPGRQEQVLSLLRLAPVRDSSILASARKLHPSPYVLALRYALGDDVEIGKEARLFVAAARIRHPGKDDPTLIKLFGDCGPDTCEHARYQFRVSVTKHESWTYYRGDVDATPPYLISDPDFLACLRHLPHSEQDKNWYYYSHFGTFDEGLILMTASIMPSDTEAYFAEGARLLSNNLDWSGAAWQNRAYLSTLLDPTVAFSDMATLCLACGLSGKEPGQTALATDALLSAWQDGRLQANALGKVLRHGLTEGIFKAARLYKSLLSAARMHELAPHLVFDLLCELLCVEADNLPKDTPSLLDLMLEVKLLTGRSLPALTRQHIELMRLSGKGKVAQKALLGG